MKTNFLHTNEERTNRHSHFSSSLNNYELREFILFFHTRGTKTPNSKDKFDKWCTPVKSLLKVSTASTFDYY
jgi:hypothetical protein